MSTTPPVFPFDPTGTKPENRIQGELQVLNPPSYSDFFFIVPLAAPFFEEGLQLVHVGTGRILVRGVDYIPSHRFQEASLAITKNIYGSITFYNKSLTGAVALSYQTLGGNWTQSEDAILELLNNALTDPRITTWEQVFNPPDRFPVIDHPWHLDDMVGAKELDESIKAVCVAIMEASDAGLPAHLSDYDNPHKVSKDQVGLSLVPNLAMANPAEASAGTSNDLFMSPLRVKQAIDTFVGGTIQAHIDDQTNPHGVNKSQVGLGDVLNYGIATPAEAADGTSNVKYMTPALVKAANTAQVGTVMASHIAALNNPHQTTKAQVGLEFVQNFPVADAVTARAGISNEHYMTPAMVREAISTMSGSDLIAHVNDFNNPHQTSKAHVGLEFVQNYGIASLAEAQAGEATNKYMTPALVKETVMAFSLNAIGDHVNNTDNPHLVTKAQVGLSNVANYGVATEAEAQAGSSTVKYMTPALVKAAIIQFADAGQIGSDLSDHINNFSNPHQTDAEQVGLGQVDNFATATINEAAAGTSETLFVTPAGIKAAIDALVDLSTYDSHLTNLNNPHQVTAAQLSAYTIAEVDALLADKLAVDGTAVDSEKLGGKSLSEIMSGVGTTVYHDASTSPAVTFTRVAAFTLESSPSNESKLPINFRIIGGATDNNVPMFQGTISGDQTVAPTVIQISGEPADIRFCTQLVTNADGQTVSELYLVGGPRRNAFRVESYGTDPRSDYSVVPDPSDLSNMFAIDDVVNNTHSVAQTNAVGDVNFGLTFSQFRQSESGLLMHRVNVRQDTDELDPLESPWADDFYEWQPYSFGTGTIYNKIYDARQWRHLQAQETPLLPSGLFDRSYGTKYTFEVELVGKGDAEGSALVGVCAAEVTRSGRSFGIYACRTPGGVVEDNSNYGLWTVAINLGRDDEHIIAATNGDGLQWPDGVWADERDFDTEPLVDCEWSNVQPVRIRVTRDDNTLTLETTNHGSTEYVDEAKVVIDLSSDLLYDVFTTASRVGLYYARGEGRVQFNALSRPGAYIPVLYSEDGVDPVLSSWNGAEWVDEDPVLAQNFRPGRILHSPHNGKLYMWRRDGSVKSMHIEADTAENYTVFAE